MERQTLEIGTPATSPVGIAILEELGNVAQAAATSASTVEFEGSKVLDVHAAGGEWVRLFRCPAGYFLLAVLEEGLLWAGSGDDPDQVLDLLPRHEVTDAVRTALA